MFSHTNTVVVALIQSPPNKQCTLIRCRHDCRKTNILTPPPCKKLWKKWWRCPELCSSGAYGRTSGTHLMEPLIADMILAASRFFHTVTFRNVGLLAIKFFNV